MSPFWRLVGVLVLAGVFVVLFGECFLLSFFEGVEQLRCCENYICLSECVCELRSVVCATC